MDWAGEMPFPSTGGLYLGGTGIPQPQEPTPSGYQKLQCTVCDVKLRVQPLQPSGFCLYRRLLPLLLSVYPIMALTCGLCPHCWLQREMWLWVLLVESLLVNGDWCWQTVSQCYATGVGAEAVSFQKIPQELQENTANSLTPRPQGLRAWRPRKFLNLQNVAHMMKTKISGSFRDSNSDMDSLPTLKDGEEGDRRWPSEHCLRSEGVSGQEANWLGEVFAATDQDLGAVAGQTPSETSLLQTLIQFQLSFKLKFCVYEGHHTREGMGLSLCNPNGLVEFKTWQGVDYMMNLLIVLFEPITGLHCLNIVVIFISVVVIKLYERNLSLLPFLLLPLPVIIRHEHNTHDIYLVMPLLVSIWFVSRCSCHSPTSSILRL